MKTTRTIKGHTVEIWEKSFAVLNKKTQGYYSTGVLFTGTTPKIEAIVKFCEALDAAHDAGKKAAKNELKAWMEI